MNRVPLIKNPVKGLDISHYDETIDFAKVKAAGYEFCWSKATESLSVVDSKYAINRQKAKAAGMLFGAYHFFRPGTDPILQAKHFLDVAKPVKGDLLPAFDWEVSQGKSDVPKAKKFLDYVEQAIGKKMVIYGPPYMLNDFGLSLEFAQYDLWVAHYTEAAPLIPAPWKHCSFHQFSEKGSVPGIPAPDEDMDLFNGSLENLYKMVI